MLITLPDGKVINVDENKLEIGQVVGDWQFQGNTTRPGDAKWNEWVNVKTGESTLKTFIPQDIPTCRDHYFEYTDNNFNYQCRGCYIGGRLSIDLNKIEDGKIIKVASKQNC
jgi:hypothetical protein